MECKFYVGQKVVCVDDSRAWPHINGMQAPVSAGGVFTISQVGLTHRLDTQKRPCVTLVEFPGWIMWSHRFRPAVETQTDISALKQIVEDVKNGKIKEYAE